tara:strand:+ start:1722 stop:1970 length:249 start_codon:yes stop_codon:yes gene_type:complete
MPRYEYKCTDCEATSTIFHLVNESWDECPKCMKKQTLKKVLSTFTTTKKVGHRSVVGETTEEFIKEAREDLKQQKRELDRER